MNNVKVTVTKEVAEAIEYLRKEIGYNFTDFMKVKTGGGWKTSPQALPLNEVRTETLASALLGGYTVEKSPGEKVREYYDRCHANMRLCYETNLVNDAHLNNGQAIGASITLDILGIKIEGVNA